MYGVYSTKVHVSSYLDGLICRPRPVSVGLSLSRTLVSVSISVPVPLSVSVSAYLGMSLYLSFSLSLLPPPFLVPRRASVPPQHRVRRAQIDRLRVALQRARVVLAPEETVGVSIAKLLH